MSTDRPIDLPLVPGASLEQAAAWFFENSSDGFALSKGGVILSVNRAWCSICRCVAQDAIGRTGPDMVHPEELSDYQAGELTLQAKGVAEFENRLRTGDGDWVWVRSSVKRGPDGYAMIVIHDLTAERAKLKESVAALESDELLRTAAGVATWRFDPDGDYFISDIRFDVADETQLVAGAKIPVAQVTAQMHPEDRSHFSQALRLSTTTGEAGKFSHRLSDGKGRWACHRASWRGLKRRENGMWELIGISQDVTELMEALDAARRGEAAAKLADDSKSEFVTNLSHEIRTPLNGVLGVLHLLADQPLSAEMKPLVAESIACGAMLTSLLNDALDLSMLEGDKVELSPQAIDAAALVENVAQMFRPRIEAKGLSLQTHVCALGGQVRVDPHRLRQILINLIGNAAKFTANGVITIREMRTERATLVA